VERLASNSLAKVVICHSSTVCAVLVNLRPTSTLALLGQQRNDGRRVSADAVACDG
jgi:hypothetical protein